MKALFSALALAATAALLWQSVTPAGACSCAISTSEELVAAADVVVLGAAEDFRGAGYGEFAGLSGTFPRNQVTFGVERYLKGSGADTIAIYEPAGSPCGVLDPQAAGRRYILFLHGVASPFQVVGICSGSAEIYEHTDPRFSPASVVREQEQWLAGIRAVTGPGVAPVTNNAPALPLGIAAVAIPLAFVLAASFVFPAKGSRA